MLLHTSNTFVPYNSKLKEADVVFVGVPFTSTSISKPALYGPTMVRESLKIFEDDDIFEKMHVCDVGDVDVVNGSFELTAKRIKETIEEIRNENKKAFIVFVGGEHGISLPIAESLKPKTILQMDAHPDIQKDYMGVKHSHATWAYHASKFTSIVQIGIEKYTEKEKKIMKECNIKSYTAEEFLKNNIILERPVHLSLDVDVFDPVHVETGFPEGSLTKKEVFSVLRSVKCDSLDIVEIADDRLPSKTGFLAAEIIKKTLQSR